MFFHCDAVTLRGSLRATCHCHCRSSKFVKHCFDIILIRKAAFSIVMVKWWEMSQHACKIRLMCCEWDIKHRGQPVAWKLLVWSPVVTAGWAANNSSVVSQRLQPCSASHKEHATDECELYWTLSHTGFKLYCIFTYIFTQLTVTTKHNSQQI